MSSASAALTRFFDTYQLALSQADPCATLPLFADTFLAAGPDGAQPVPIAAFAPVLLKRKQLFDKLGCRSTELVSVQEVPIESRYSLARTKWQMTFTRPDLSDESITVESTFLIDTETQRILLYLAHQDVFALLRRRGILAE